MQAERAYQKYLIEKEANGVNDGISTDKGRFVVDFNRAQNRYLALLLQAPGSDDIRWVQKFLVTGKKLTEKSKTKYKYDFAIPKDFFDLANAKAIAKKDSCKDSLFLYEIKIQNLNEVLQDEYLKPSFPWREAPFTISSDNVTVYIDDFEIESILLDYYRYPKQIELIDETNPESNFANIEIEWDEKALNDIITLTVVNTDINENNNRFQANLTKISK